MAKPTHSQMPKGIRQHKRNAGKSQGTENILRAKTRELRERVKELDCLYSISRFIERPGITIPEILQGAVNALPQAWQYPRLASARVVFGSHIVTSKIPGDPVDPVPIHQSPGKSRRQIGCRLS